MRSCTLLISHAIYSVLLYCPIYSMQKTLKTMESRHSVKQRWKPGDREFDSAALQIINEHRKDTLSALHALSIERHFLLKNTKKEVCR